ncbi:MAG: hypothetical protein WCS20_14190, partial [Alphaproteobacteria bacterium]
PQSRPKTPVKPAATTTAADTPTDSQAAKDKAAVDKAAQKATAQAEADKLAAAKAAKKAAAQSAADKAALEAAVAGAAGTQGVANDGPKGPPMSSGEIDGLRVAIKRCWNLGTLSSAAMEVMVTVRVNVAQNGKPDFNSIRMTSFDGGAESAANKVFEAARSAIFRCGRSGLPLPPDKYDTWKDLELVFDPRGMRLR